MQEFFGKCSQAPVTLREEMVMGEVILEEKYKKLFDLYTKSRPIFYEVVERIGADRLNLDMLYSYLSGERNSCVLDGVRWVLLTHFDEALSLQTLRSFLCISGDSLVQEKARKSIEKRYIKENNLRQVADEIVDMFF
jgi:hypothetical protein